MFYDVLPHYTQQNILNTGKKLLSDPIVNFRSFSRKMTTTLPLLQPGVSCYPINTCLKEKAYDSFFWKEA